MFTTKAKDSNFLAYNVPQKKVILYKLLDEQMELYFPDKIEKIDSWRILAKKIGSHKWSLAHIDEKTGQKVGWIISYLTERYGSISLARKIFDEIWSSRSYNINPSTYDDAVEFVENRGGRVITERKQWDSNKKEPQLRELEIQCENDEHDPWSTNFEYLLRNRWCPICQEKFCQKILGMYMEKVLTYLAGKPIKIESKKTLSNAYGIPWNPDGRLQYDKYVSSVEIKGKMKGKGSYVKMIVSVCGEYDGIQHDIFPNQYYQDEIDRPKWNRIRQRDKRKDDITFEKGTHTIRLKAIWKYNKDTIDSFQEEIIRQLQDWTGLKFDSMPKWIYNKWTNELEEDPSGEMIDVPLDPNAPCKPKLNKGPMDKFLG